MDKQTIVSETSGHVSKERVQKVLARSGLGSRRQLEKSIKMAQMYLNGKLVELGQTVGEGDIINWKNRKWVIQTKPLDLKILMYHKPLGQICTRNDEKNRPTVFDNLPELKRQRWISIGRLDINTTGLLLFTTDGNFANHMMHPSAQIDREYACRVFGEVNQLKLDNLRKGVELEDGKARFNDIQQAGAGESNQWFHVVLLEGKNREVRRLWESQDLKVSRLKRVRYGGVFLPKKLYKGQYQLLTQGETNILLQDVKYKLDNVELIARSLS
ncbi:Ribosomal large subunit pseudouridine synthase B [hydrothermal vent metagenome]|uniref:Ribosomal large subunit pseudouridine synthase B n=1 Tax=hydrothermal vent metagenome TaxID=652676 RepID=A0A3B0VNN5_9ZZZZ